MLDKTTLPLESAGLVIDNGGGDTVPLADILAPGEPVTLVKCRDGGVLAVPEAELRRFDRPAPRPDADSETPLLPAQDVVSAKLDDAGNLVLRQSSWPDDDAVITVASPLVDLFVDRLTDLLGYGSAGRP